MSKLMNPIVIIPARMNSTRLPGKPLADIHGEAMIVHVWRRVCDACVGPVYVACADREIAQVVESAGGNAVLTRPDHLSGSDRIHEALITLDTKEKFDTILNVQGDLPTITPDAIQAVFSPLENKNVDISTLVCEISKEEERDNPNVVKAVISLTDCQRSGRVLYFSRMPVPSGNGPYYHHIGLYAYRRTTLERFISLRPGTLEIRENLEQLRALEHGMRIDAALVDTIPLGVDTLADLEQARNFLEI